MTLPKPFITIGRRHSAQETRHDSLSLVVISDDGNCRNINGGNCSGGSGRSSSGVSSSSPEKIILPLANSSPSPRGSSFIIRRRSASGSGSSSSASSPPSSLSRTMMMKVSPSLREVNLPEEFDILKTLNEGIYTKVLLVKKGQDKLVLKAVSQDSTSKEGFLQEVSYNYFLSPHPSIVKSFNVGFVWDEYYLFPMEQAPFGNLYRFLKNGTVCLPEASVKLIANQLASALEFLHGFKLVHRDVKPENVLVFKQNFSQIKLCDFGSTRPEKTLVSRRMESSTSSCAPEVSQLVVGENYYASPGQDVWQVGILLFVCLTGGEPWDRADISDPGYTEYTDWLRRKSLRVPESFLPFTPRLVRLLKRLLEPKPKKRCEIREVYKYLEDEWLCKLHRQYSFKRGALERKSSSSTSRSRSTNNASFRRRSSFRSTPQRGGSCRAGSMGLGGGGMEDGNNKLLPILGHRNSSKSSGGGGGEDYDKRFVQQRIGRWVLEAAKVPPAQEDPDHDDNNENEAISTNHLAVVESLSS